MFKVGAAAAARYTMCLMVPRKSGFGIVCVWN
jgi:hypothetical protein